MYNYNIMLKECFITIQGISCITTDYSLNNILEYSKYIHGYIIFRIAESILKDIVNNKNEFKKINLSDPYMDF